MSRLDPKIAEENRKDFNKRIVINDHRRAVMEWLRKNPEIGSLNGGKYYRIVDGKTVMVKELS